MTERSTITQANDSERQLDGIRFVSMVDERWRGGGGGGGGGGVFNGTLLDLGLIILIAVNHHENET